MPDTSNAEKLYQKDKNKTVYESLGFTPREFISLIATLILTVLAGFLAYNSMRSENYFILAISMGAVGGLLHEFVQSGGKIFFFQKEEDGIYLGSISGIILGVIAGTIFFRGELDLLNDPSHDINVYQFAIDVFFAGLGLKGVAEAASGVSVKSKNIKNGKNNSKTIKDSEDSDNEN